MKFLQLLIVFIGVLSFSAPVMAEDATPFKMSFPLKCELHKDCWLLYYVDVNRTKGETEDFACGKRSYDQHKGTDFAIRDYHAMQKGIDVLAVAPGKVLRLRDSVEDSFKNKEELEAVREAKIECGNGVFIDHGDGYATQYCHLKKDSVIVKKGDQVERGQKIGQVGISGLAEHPHLHLTLYKDNKLMDPFMGKDVSVDCSKEYYQSKTYWDDTLPARDEAPSFYDSDFATAVPKFDDIPKGKRGETPKVGAKAFVFWAAMFDIRIGDYITMKITGENGQEFVSRTISQDKDRIRQYYVVGKKVKQGMPAGTYTGEVAITRVMDDGNTKTYRHSKVITLE